MGRCVRKSLCYQHLRFGRSAKKARETGGRQAVSCFRQ